MPRQCIVRQGAGDERRPIVTSGKVAARPPGGRMTRYELAQLNVAAPNAQPAGNAPSLDEPCPAT